ncbi:MAG TPA: class I SAM-dependent methyltransferase [Candidatus Kapabacteria bacterium]|nr:class I SAM-dependent methyltransferase [Candidatus Kapabacteria bacterium]
MNNSTTRFSSRVDNYIKYRPAYPPEVIDVLKKQCGLTEDSIVADIGSGTGILTELFLRNGNMVYGVEPNKEMREAGERLLSGYPNFKSITGTAETTTLPDHSIDIIAAGQAFHWFDRALCRNEFARILKSGGWVALIWNLRKTIDTPFLSAYQELLHTYGTDYAAVDHAQIGMDIIKTFFAPNPVSLATLPNEQVFDLDGLRGRLLSSSYTPEPGDPRYGPMLKELGNIFNIYQVNGKVHFEYDTNVYYGKLEK